MESKEIFKNQKVIDIRNLDSLEAIYLGFINSGAKSQRVNDVVAKVRLLDEIGEYEREHPELTDVDKEKIKEELVKLFELKIDKLETKNLKQTINYVMENLEKDIDTWDISEKDNDLSLLLDVCFLRLSSNIHKDEQSYKKLPKYTVNMLQRILGLKGKAEENNNTEKSIKIESEMEKYSEQLVELYNLVFGPAQNLKEDIDSNRENGKGEKIEDAVVAVYGAMYDKMIDRIRGLEVVSEKVNIDNGIIFSGSGGRFWHINPDAIRGKIMKSIQKDLDREKRLVLVQEVGEKMNRNKRRTQNR